MPILKVSALRSRLGMMKLATSIAVSRFIDGICPDTGRAARLF
jgi:hypothetical protein